MPKPKPLTSLSDLGRITLPTGDAIPSLAHMVGRYEVPTASVTEWDKNPAKRAEVSDQRLEETIRSENILCPLAVVRLKSAPEGQTWLCIDGNRRLRIANRLGIRAVPIIEVPSERVVAILNSTGKLWDVQTWAQFVAITDSLAVLRHLPDKLQQRIEYAMTVLGQDFSGYVRTHTLTALGIAGRVAAQVGRSGDTAFIKTTVFWIIKHSQVQVVSDWVRGYARFSQSAVLRAIADDVPLAYSGGREIAPIKLTGERGSAR